MKCLTCDGTGEVPDTTENLAEANRRASFDRNEALRRGRLDPQDLAQAAEVADEPVVVDDESGAAPAVEAAD